MEPDSRRAGAVLVEKYGLRRIDQIKVVLRAVPESVPEQRRLVMISVLLDLPLSSTEELVRDIWKLAPKFVEENACQAKHHVLCPPVMHCLNGCRYRIGPDKGSSVALSWHRDPTEARLYSPDGSISTVGALTLRCTICESRFGYQYWTTAGIYHLYSEPRDLVQVSQAAYVSRSFAGHIANLIYFDHGTYEGIAASYQNSYGGWEGFSRKLVSSIFIRYEIECDLTERGLRGYSFVVGQTMFQYIDFVIPLIFAGIYTHDCSAACSASNCGRLFTMDGLWKMGFRHCKAVVINTVNSVPLIRFPNVCTNGCIGQSEYCLEHEWMAATITAAVAQKTATQLLIPGGAQVVASLLDETNALLSGELESSAEVYDCTEFNPDKQCTKNKGAEGRSYYYSRGYIFIVGSTGHIYAFLPLFRAESLGQVFLFVISWLYQTLQLLPVEEWGKFFLAYDNMCQLSRLKAASQPLPLPEPFDLMWTKIKKIVDGLHIRNHKDSRCKLVYDPNLYYEVYPEAKAAKQRNTMAAEQTFAWLANFRKQINAMPKNRQIFFIHRLIVRRNAYLSRCIAKSKKPVGAPARTFRDKGNKA